MSPHLLPEVSFTAGSFVSFIRECGTGKHIGRCGFAASANGRSVRPTCPGLAGENPSDTTRKESMIQGLDTHSGLLSLSNHHNFCRTKLRFSHAAQQSQLNWHQTMVKENIALIAKSNREKSSSFLKDPRSWIALGATFGEGLQLGDFLLIWLVEF